MTTNAKEKIYIINGEEYHLVKHTYIGRNGRLGWNMVMERTPEQIAKNFARLDAERKEKEVR